MKATLALITLTLVSGCASVATPQRAQQLDDKRLCELAYDLPRGGIYGHRLNPIVKEEINRRALMTENEWRLAENQQIQRGMSECALLVSWGIPSKVNRSVGAWGVHSQYVYRGYRTSGYAYVENGRVSGWQQ